MKNHKGKYSGTVTVEASVLFGMLCIVAGILISLTIHVYQRAWYTAAACETVLTGSGKGILKEADGVALAQKKWETLCEDFYQEPDGFSSCVGGDEDIVQVQMKGNTLFWGYTDVAFSLEKQMKILRPVPFIRKMAAWKDGGD